LNGGLLIARRQPARFNPKSFLGKVGEGKTLLTFPKRQIIFSQGDEADAVFYFQEGKVKLSVVSPQGKEAIVAILECAAFFGESCLARQTVRAGTSTILEDSILVRIAKQAMIDALHNQPTFSMLLVTYLLSRNIRIQEDLVDQLLNSSETWPARMLLLMAHFWKEGRLDAVIAKISQDTLVEMIGTTNSRVSLFLNKFRKMGFIDYTGGLHAHSSLLIVLHT
jgi:CRP-like cAMP-binding protein